MKTRKEILVLALMVALTTGCSQENPAPDSPQSDITTTTRTTASGNNWTEGDAIGLFILTEDGILPRDIISGGNNLKYEISDSQTGELTLVGSSSPAYFPQSGSVDLVAYHPHQATIEDHSLTLDLRNQNNLSAIDLLYAHHKGAMKNNAAIELEFSHAMSKATFHLKAGEGISSAEVAALTAADISLDGLPTEVSVAFANADFPLFGVNAVDTYHPAKAETTDGFDATFTAIVCPQSVTSTSLLRCTLTGSTYTAELQGPFESENHYQYTVTIRKTGISLNTPSITEWTTNDHQPQQAIKLPDVVDISPTSTPFLMGSSDGSNPSDADLTGLNTTPEEAGRLTHETHHWVALTEGFRMTQHEITNAQYAIFLNAKSVMGETSTDPDYDNRIGAKCTWGEYAGMYLAYGPAEDLERILYWDSVNMKWAYHPEDENLPVIMVTWYGAHEYAKWIGGALPTEAQWEYACRAETNTAFFFGNDASLLPDYAWCADNSWQLEGGALAEVGQKLPNAWGLYDMYGNAAEWCADWYGGPYGATTVSNPQGPSSGAERILRGGDSYASFEWCRSASREYYAPKEAALNRGFRVVFSLTN